MSFFARLVFFVMALGPFGLVNALTSESHRQAKQTVLQCLSDNIQTTSNSDLRNLGFQNCIWNHVSSHQDENEINDFMHEFVTEQQLPELTRRKRFKRQVPHVDESLVSAFLNSPEAVKMVLSYLGKSSSNRRTQVPETTTTPRPAPKRRRPPPPPLSFFFGGDKPLSALLNEHRQTIKKIKQNDWDKSKSSAKPPPPLRFWTTSSPAPALNVFQPKVDEARHPTLGQSPNVHPEEAVKSDMQFFGPKDFVPKAPHSLPLRPMRLKYASTHEFPSKVYGRLVPMPR